MEEARVGAKAIWREDLVTILPSRPPGPPPFIAALESREPTPRATAAYVIAITKIACSWSARPTEPRVEDVAQAVTEDVEGADREQDREPGKQRQPRLRADE